MPLLGHIGLALATSLSGLIAGAVMAVLLRRRHRLDGACVGMMVRIILATIIMAIFLVSFANFGSGLRQLVRQHSG